jgi:AcrR family transcriptional regulator
MTAVKKSGMASASLRTRMREKLKDEFREIALELFLEKGFDKVSIEQIALQAGTSQRALSHYFDSKEEILLAWLDHFAPVVYDALRNAPKDMPPWDALKRAFVSTLRHEGGPGKARRVELVYRLAHDSPKLRAGISERSRAWAREIAKILAARIGVDRSSDLRPDVWAALVMTLVTAPNEWALEFGQEELVQENPSSIERAFEIFAELPVFGRPAASGRQYN